MTEVRKRVVDRLLDRRRVVRRAVMRLPDQARNNMPTVCVKSGVHTDMVIRTTAVATRHPNTSTIAFGHGATVLVARLLRVPVTSASVPISERAYRTWQSRLRLSVAITSIGLALAAVGIVRGIGALIAFGMIAVVTGWLNRVRAWHNAWIGIEYRPSSDEIVLSRVHSVFDNEAAAIYQQSMMRRRP